MVLCVNFILCNLIQLGDLFKGFQVEYVNLSAYKTMFCVNGDNLTSSTFKS